MKADSVLEETWRVKDDLAREADYDVHKLFEALRAYERAHADVPRIRSAEELRRLSPPPAETLALHDKLRQP